jgi:DUF917 family protein
MSVRRLGKAELEAAILGGLLLSSGGSGMTSSARHRALGEEALALGEVRLAPLDTFGAEDYLVVATAVGAPGTSGARTRPGDSLAAARAIEAACGRRLAGAMVAHVPGLYAWTIAAGLGIALADAGTNGRAHPTERMGGMGLASKPDAVLWQAAYAAGADGDPPLSVLAHGHPTKTSHVLRAASVQNGGLINAARGPFTAAFVRGHGAPGAISFALDLGAAALAVRGEARVAAAAEFLGGLVLIEGEVDENTVRYGGGFDTGVVTVKSGARRVALGVYNEFMTADEAGERVCTFPDFLGSLDPASGNPVAISALNPGARVAVVMAPRTRIPLGAGVFDRTVYAEVEAAMGCALSPYVFT